MNTKIIFGIAIGTVLVLGAIFWAQSKEAGQVQSLESSGDLVSAAGIHWHPELKIVLKGEEVTIPANVGIGMQYAGHPQYDPMMRMTNMHTHDDSGELHWEVMEGPVTKEDVKLGNFFSVWGKKFDENCIFESCNGEEGAVKMFVNGEPNTEFQNYAVKDKDKIEILYD